MLLLIGILYAPVSYASEIALHKVDIELGEDEIAYVTAEVHYKELTTSDVPYFVLGKAYEVQARDDVSQLECRTVEQPYGTYISCAPSHEVKNNYTVYFNFKLVGLVSTTPNFKRFVYNYGIKEPTELFIFRISLPEGYGLVKTQREQVMPYFPQNAIIGSDGRHVTLEWHVDNPELGDTLTFNVMYEYVGIQPFNLLYYVLPLLGVISVLGVLLIKFRSREDIMSVLTQDERRVIEVIRSKGDRYIKQKEIVRATNFSKAKVSRILATLEERGLIIRERVGRTNKVKLLKKF